jgi:hypothetical protein
MGFSRHAPFNIICKSRDEAEIEQDQRSQESRPANVERQVCVTAG